MGVKVTTPLDPNPFAVKLLTQTLESEGAESLYATRKSANSMAREKASRGSTSLCLTQNQMWPSSSGNWEDLRTFFGEAVGDGTATAVGVTGDWRCDALQRDNLGDGDEERDGRLGTPPLNPYVEASSPKRCSGICLVLAWLEASANEDWDELCAVLRDDAEALKLSQAEELAVVGPSLRATPSNTNLATPAVWHKIPQKCIAGGGMKRYLVTFD
ncbi:hypothetical protein BJ165DRAFT_1404853 [Panaeolus papilionaceus]|nr:hypothetical protein BJ165DRAFT_1404853 [Panaeolus papilionaceus]